MYKIIALNSDDTRMAYTIMFHETESYRFSTRDHTMTEVIALVEMKWISVTMVPASNQYSLKPADTSHTDNESVVTPPTPQ